VVANLALDLASALDPVQFARSAGIEPDPWQADVLRSTDRRVLMNASRQSGKSTVSALIALHEALYTPSTLVLLLSPSLRQSSELFRTLARLYAGMGASVGPKAESALRLELENGSRIISLPASEATIRGYSGVSLLVIDEASRVEDHLYLSVLPMLATTDGRLIALSTPFGKRGWWSEAWHAGETRWKRVEVSATDCPRISEAFLEEQRLSMGEFWFRQEFFCEFIDSDSAAFRTEDVEAAAYGEVVQTWQL
jgi:hypothetical protein